MAQCLQFNTVLYTVGLPNPCILHLWNQPTSDFDPWLAESADMESQREKVSCTMPFYKKKKKDLTDHLPVLGWGLVLEQVS